MVLATDMKRHTRLVAKIQALVEQKRSQGNWFEKKDPDEIRTLLSIGIHVADISSASKKLPQALEWAHRIHDEFWKQGDKERELGIPVTAVMDRNRPNFAKSQMAFVNMVVDPLYRIWINLVPQTSTILYHQDRNLQYWKSRVDTLAAIKSRGS
jgi:hypothetical protein